MRGTTPCLVQFICWHISPGPAYSESDEGWVKGVQWHRGTQLKDDFHCPARRYNCAQGDRVRGMQRHLILAARPLKQECQLTTFLAV